MRVASKPSWRSWLSAAITERLRPLEDELARLDTIPGVDRQTTEVLLAEIGTEMVKFPTSGHLASWAGMCSGNHESVGKRTSGETRKGSTWLRRALTEAAHGAARTKQPGRCALVGDYRRLVARRARRKRPSPWATASWSSPTMCCATGRSIGSSARNRAVDQLRQLGFEATLTPKEDAA